MTHPAPTVLAFDDIVLDLPGRRLLRAGQAQALEPKAFAVLALLAGSPGQVFSREEILDEVWGHRHVTPGVLNRVITLVRHALGEDAQSPHYLHTVHGYGYRFDMPQPDEVAAQSGLPQSSPEVPPPVAERPAGPPRRRASDQAAAPAPMLARRTWPWLAALAVVLAGTLVAWQWLADRPRQAASPPVLAVLPLQALGDDARGQAFADGLSEEMIGLLAHIDGLRVISHTASFRFRDSKLPLAEIARRLRATHLLEGSVRQERERLRITLRLVEAGSDRTLWSQTFDRELRDIFDLQRNVAHAIGNALQLQLGLLPARSQAGEDPALYRRYLLARSASPHSEGDRGLAAESELRALAREHPDYARAWGGLASILWMRSLPAQPGRDELRAQAEQAAATALRLDPQQPDAHTVLASRACRLQQWSQCLALSRQAVSLAPSNVASRAWHAHALATTGYVDLALREVDAALLIAPFDPGTHFLRGRLLDTLGRHEEARQALTLSNPTHAATALFFNAIWRRDYADAQRRAETLPTELPWRASELAATAALQDPAKWPQVLPAIEQSERHPMYGQVRYDFSRLLLPVRDYARDIDALDAVQRAGYASYQWVFWQPESRALRQDPAFRSYLERSGLLAHWREHGWPTLCRVDGDDVRCD